VHKKREGYLSSSSLLRSLSWILKSDLMFDATIYDDVSSCAFYTSTVFLPSVRIHSALATPMMPAGVQEAVMSTVQPLCCSNVHYPPVRHPAIDGSRPSRISRLRTKLGRKGE
jgi:hypothetical protein